jgi:photosystem II stability/assembly factor-like uncharacterized protein
VHLATRVDGTLIDSGKSQTFNVVPLRDGGTLPGASPSELAEFNRDFAETHRAISGARRALGDTSQRVEAIIQALDRSTVDEDGLGDQARAMAARIADKQGRLQRAQVPLGGPRAHVGAHRRLRGQPAPPAEYYVAVCSGNVWKTTNNGITYEPVFDNEGSYSIGCVTLDPNDPTSSGSARARTTQRSVSFGDGVYKSIDGGKSWKNMGLKESEHIGMIAVDPRDSDRVFVAAQGPLWRSGGDRGLYMTEDGGETWEKVLESPSTPASTRSTSTPRPRRHVRLVLPAPRHVWTLINGGPESGVWKSTDGGRTWREINKGLPGRGQGPHRARHLARRPDVLYAIVEAANGESGFYRSTNRGESWEKMSDYVDGQPAVLQRDHRHPHDVTRSTRWTPSCTSRATAGKTFSRVPKQEPPRRRPRAVDRPRRPPAHDRGLRRRHLRDLGRRGENWRYKVNLPVTQFYRVSVDMDEPFYNIYGGTQDNNSQGGPRRTTAATASPTRTGTSPWAATATRPSSIPRPADIVYSQWQYGGLVRHDRRSGEITDIRPSRSRATSRTSSTGTPRSS